MLPAQSFDTDYELKDRYLREDGRVFLTGIQALTRLPIMQARLDRAAGLNTAGFISGYRGSPLGGYDQELTRSKEFLDQHNILFRAGLNEDLAATAVWGTQQLDIFEGAKYDGVFGMWYGKGPGVDRSGDVFRHANAFGTSKHGGVLALAGDDHGVQSSTIAHQSDHVFMGYGMPIFQPSNVAEFLELGLAGFALSRFAGCWVGFKTVTEVVESSASVEINPIAPRFIIPEDVVIPPRGLNFDPTLRWPQERWDLETLQQQLRLDAARAFARANKIDKVVMTAERPRIGIITTGKAYQDVLHALKELRIEKADAERIGLTIYKVGMSWPLEPTGIREFAKGLKEIIVIEEKRSIVERQVKDILYHEPEGQRPLVIGKKDERDQEKLSPLGELNPRKVASLIMERIRGGEVGNDMDAKFKRILQPPPETRINAAPVNRSPYFCSGCPHNTSTKVPEGSHAMGGIGCHIMSLMMDRKTDLFTHMGAEGVNWTGMEPFTDVNHIFQNLGDGTYEHSGILAVRAAIQAKSNITYKILYNDAVAMTGGQPIMGQMTVKGIYEQLKAEGVARIAIVSENDPAEAARHYHLDEDRWQQLSFHHRDDMEYVQRMFRETPGVTSIIYDQTCAAEKRRRRKRGLMEDPPVRVFVNDLVCEGCGDCSVQSNCVSVEPLTTELGIKRKINQSACNKDLSCVKGFCPSFVTVHGGAVRQPDPRRFASEEADLMKDLPAPTLQPSPEPHYNILVGGIGGTGVVTIGALISMAAHLEGKGVTGLDFTGLAQKNGAVISHIRIADTPAGLDAVRIGELSADLLLGCDMVVAGGLDALTRCDRGRTWALVNTHETPTADFTLNTNTVLPVDLTTGAIKRSIGEDRTTLVDVTSYAFALFGDAIASNLMLLGHAYQQGYIPLSVESIERAITLNGVSVKQNLRSFRWGRLLAHDPEAVKERAFAEKFEADPIAETFEDKLARRIEHLTGYQNAAYAQRYENLVNKAKTLDESLGRHELTEAVLKNYFKLLAYKDEYEVARLYTDGRFRQKLRSEFAGDYKLELLMAPPLLAKKDTHTGLRKKRAFNGRFVFPFLGILAKGKALRGTWADPFGYQEERRFERALIAKYEATLDALFSSLGAGNYQKAVEIANLPDRIRGFGHIKEENRTSVEEEWDVKLRQFQNPDDTKLAAE
ncbi:MAG: indolepyruvate ferredoxin oxidoreductase family protein [Alphaproteobacteria bacterium]|nr:MAG: indolepyruvate ferredoxin oxidoreductase family protein [Alphaproteobacteria bacterium]